MRSTFCRLLQVGFIVFVAATGSSADASWRPDRPLRIFVPFTAGGASDTLVRVVAAEVTHVAGVPIIVENRPGASGKVMYEAMKSASGDGYTLGYVSSTVAVLTAVSSRLNFDVVKDFKPVTVMAEFDALIVANGALPVSNFREFVSYAKARPGELFYASYGVKGHSHLLMEGIKHLTGIEVTHVPYKGETPTVAALLANEVQFGPLILSPKQYVDEGKLKVLAAAGSSRHPEFPDVETLEEQGVPYSAKTWMGLAAPLNTSADAVSFWNAAFVEVLTKPALIQKLKELGFRARGTAPGEVTQELERDIRQFRAAVTNAQIELD